MPKRSATAMEGRPNRARNKRTLLVHEAHELRDLDNPRADEWECYNKHCRAPMAPRACERVRPDGGLWLKSAYFTSEGKHADDCRPAPEPHEQSLPNSTSGAPVSFPSEIYLFTDLSKPGAAALLSERRAGHDWSDSFHDSRERSIRRACMFYAEDAANHSRRLWVQRCAGNSYAECFVLLGTGFQEIVGPLRIFYGQIHFRSPIRYDAEPLVIPLMSYVGGVQRQLEIHTGSWTSSQRNDLVERIYEHVEDGRSAHWHGDKSRRPWIFFVSCEEIYDQITFQVDLYAGIETLFCLMPRQQRRFRPSAFSSPRPSSEAAQPEGPAPYDTIEPNAEQSAPETEKAAGPEPPVAEPSGPESVEETHAGPTDEDNILMSEWSMETREPAADATDTDADLPADEDETTGPVGPDAFSEDTGEPPMNDMPAAAISAPSEPPKGFWRWLTRRWRG